ncbi:reverse transcriptase domain, Reverse transcriptase zinc-binding domain protein [Artemisia annua]|uniref:Reverse transcriptase domain, Reverse transcriptase zinc-binding domain protein n=1 Tax=Artemisia annua TaxID=35608 RepID=A0A2U1LMY7_ARTAN|nr:reverse transcriptase domain, Reverse transcriptase zinc-binding domain protein [Artemisia annua]
MMHVSDTIASSHPIDLKVVKAFHGLDDGFCSNIGAGLHMEFGLTFKVATMPLIELEVVIGGVSLVVRKFIVQKLASLVDWSILGPFYIGYNHNWNNWTPTKVNICIWKAANKRLPTLSAINSKGIFPASSLCPLSNETTETIDHVLYECILVRQIWLKCWRWWGIVALAHFFIIDAIFRSLAPTDSKLWRNRVVHASNDENDTIEEIFPQIQ